jgi:hypothetical protein
MDNIQKMAEDFKLKPVEGVELRVASYLEYFANRAKSAISTDPEQYELDFGDDNA